MARKRKSHRNDNYNEAEGCGCLLMMLVGGFIIQHWQYLVGIIILGILIYFIIYKMGSDENNQTSTIQSTTIQSATTSKPLISEPTFSKPNTQNTIIQKSTFQKPVVQNPIVYKPILYRIEKFKNTPNISLDNRYYLSKLEILLKSDDLYRKVDKHYNMSHILDNIFRKSPNENLIDLLNSVSENTTINWDCNQTINTKLFNFLNEILDFCQKKR